MVWFVVFCFDSQFNMNCLKGQRAGIFLVLHTYFLNGYWEMVCFLILDFSFQIENLLSVKYTNRVCMDTLL